MGHPNEEVVRSGYEAFAKGDIDTLRALLDPDVVWHQPGRSVLAGDHPNIWQVPDSRPRRLGASSICQASVVARG